MKYNKFALFFLSSVALMSCSDENPWLTESGEGRISPHVVADNSIKDVVPITRGTEVLTAPAVELFGLELTKSDGSYSQSWDSVEAFPTDEMFDVGNYVMSAHYGDANKEGFDMPYFYGSEEFKVEQGETTDVNIVASLANTMVSIDYTDAFKNYFKTYSTQLHSKGGDYIVFVPGETRPAYLRPGEMSLTVSLEKQNGVSASFEPAKIQTVAKHHYHITLDVNNSEVGDAQLVILFDESVVEENVIIDLSDDLMMSPEPEVAVKGFVPDELFDVYECQSADSEKQFQIIAKGGLGSVTLTTHSTQLLEKGLPEEIDLMSASAAQQALLKQLGFEVAGLWKNPDKMALIDLQNLFKNIVGTGTHEFTLVVKDKLTKVSQPVRMVASTQAVELSIVEVEASKIGTNYSNVTFEYTGNLFDKNVSVEALNSNGVWVACQMSNLTNEGSRYVAKLSLPDGMHEVQIRAKYCGQERATATIARHGVVLSCEEYDIWGSKAIVNVTTIPATIALEDVDIYISSDGENYVKHTNVVRDATNKRITLSGLAPGVKYNVKASETDQYEQSYPSLLFTTETAQQVGNAGFENWSTYDWSFNHNGSLGGQSSPMKYYKPWASGATDMWWDSNTTTSLRNSLTIGYTYFKTFPLVHYSTDAHSGNHAAQITVANVGNTNSTWGTTGTWYVGELLIGKGNDGSNGGWSRSSEGHDFASRPTSLTFWYEYLPYTDSDTFAAELWLKAADGTVIATASLPNGGAASEWRSVNLPLNYTVYDKKAASIFIAFKASTSSSHSCDKGGEWLEIAGSKGSGDAYRIKLSATLRVDDIQLNY